MGVAALRDKSLLNRSPDAANAKNGQGQNSTIQAFCGDAKKFFAEEAENSSCP